MYVIADNGHCVINGLRQVTVYETREQAEREWVAMIATHGTRMNGFTVQEIHYAKESN